MTRRIRFDQNGLRVSRPGWDAATAGPNNLLLAATARVEQLILQGTAYNGQFVPYSLSHSPYVLLTSLSPILVGEGQAGTGVMRPWPFYDQNHNSYVVAGTNGMSIAGGSAGMYYHVFRRAI